MPDSQIEQRAALSVRIEDMVLPHNDTTEQELVQRDLGYGSMNGQTLGVLRGESGKRAEGF
jgi:hypothetical protein